MKFIAGGGRTANIFVDGKRIRKVFFADTETGIVRAYVYPFEKNEDGASLKTYEIKGVVTIEDRNSKS